MPLDLDPHGSHPQVTESKTKKGNRKGSTSSTSSSSSSSVVDPLSSVLDGTDPLSMFAATADPVATAAVTVTHPQGAVQLGVSPVGLGLGGSSLV